jgi:hypothetical protein
MFSPGIDPENGVSIHLQFNILKGCEIWEIRQWKTDEWKQGEENV